MHASAKYSASFLASAQRSFRSVLGAFLLAAPMGYAQVDDDASLSAGTFTVARTDASAYSEPAPALSYQQREKFLRGRAHFQRPWVVFGVGGGDWGLGPTFIADRCDGCHVGGGRGAPPLTSKDPLRSMLVRLSIPGVDAHGGPNPHPNYGDQLQNNALQGQNTRWMYSGNVVPIEAEIYLDWDEHTVAFADGDEVHLRKPRLRIEQLAFGVLAPDVMYSLRNTQAMFGLGLLEAVPEQRIVAIAEQQKSRGLNGRPNYVWDEINQRQALGRFGWKANQPSVRQQIAAAAIGDMGVTSDLFPKQNCPGEQQICRNEVPGNNPELIASDWNELEFWTLGLGVPARRDWNDAQVRRGGELFEKAQCDGCHLPELRTGEKFPALPVLTNQEFHAYTDLLLHDMGEGLADGRPEFAASGRDWRTAPLWGLGLSATVNGSTALLHDGRARDVTEAILWHGGEAYAAREAFRRMPKDDRAALLKFLNAI